MTVADVATSRAEIRAFLRSRRARLSPQDVGLVAGPRRRTPGLRREEVAQLAGVGVSWYTWLEQGRNITVSGSVLDAISVALRLTEPERAYLYRLAGVTAGSSVAENADVTTELAALVQAWTPRPAMLQDRYWNLKAINSATRELFGYGDTDQNCLVAFFTNSRYRDMYVEWEAAAPAVVAAFRADAARYPADPGFGAIVEALSACSREFVELWRRHDVGPHVHAVKAIHHPSAGALIFDKTTLAVPDRPGWHLVLYNPRPGTGTADRLPLISAVS